MSPLHAERVNRLSVDYVKVLRGRLVEISRERTRTPEMWSDAAVSTWKGALTTTLGVVTAASMFLADADELIAKVARMHAMVIALSQTLPVSVDISHNVGLQIAVLVTR